MDKRPKVKVKAFKIMVPEEPYRENAMETANEQQEYSRLLNDAIADTLYVYHKLLSQNTRLGRPQVKGSFDPFDFQPHDLSQGDSQSPFLKPRRGKGRSRSTR